MFYLNWMDDQIAIIKSGRQVEYRDQDKKSDILQITLQSIFLDYGNGLQSSYPNCGIYVSICKLFAVNCSMHNTALELFTRFVFYGLFCGSVHYDFIQIL